MTKENVTMTTAQQQVTLTDPQLSQVLDTFDIETRFRLMRLLTANPEALDTKKFMSLDIVEGTLPESDDDDDYEQPSFKCPHCDHEFPADELETFRVATYENELNTTYPHRKRVEVYMNSMNVDDLSLNYTCPRCEEPVDLPHRWSWEY